MTLSLATCMSRRLIKVSRTRGIFPSISAQFRMISRKKPDDLSTRDNILAVASGAGKTALCVIRISGPNALTVLPTFSIGGFVY